MRNFENISAASEAEELRALASMIYYCERQLDILAPSCAVVANLLRSALMAEANLRSCER